MDAEMPVQPQQRAATLFIQTERIGCGTHCCVCCVCIRCAHRLLLGIKTKTYRYAHQLSNEGAFILNAQTLLGPKQCASCLATSL